MRNFMFFLCLAFFSQGLVAQKAIHIPKYLQNDSRFNNQLSWDKTAQSDNFILIWGNTVGTDPTNYTADSNLTFNPTDVLNNMEYLYQEFKTLAFLDDAPGTELSKFKIPIVIYNTWGNGLHDGWANGADVDGTIGAFWVHPRAAERPDVIAHEFTHSLQAQCNLDARKQNGLGNCWLDSGIFWECHANFMRNVMYPHNVKAWGMDRFHLEAWGDWKNTYENYHVLIAITEDEGIGMINRLWRESYSNEFPLQAYKRIAGYSQSVLNDKLFSYARRMATFDFTYKNMGQYLRNDRANDLNNSLESIQNVHSILEAVPNSENRYYIPIEQAPEEFSYNVIPLYPEQSECPVNVKFKGHTETNNHTAWRYGFAAATSDGLISRYSDTYSDNTGEVSFQLEGTETDLYLIVMGTSKDVVTTSTSRDTYKGYPKHYRFPYELSIEGAVPEGFQDPSLFRTQLKNSGSTHSNGGGWVANTATVANSVYVSKRAVVTGNSNISGNVRIENTAVVKDATLSDNAKVLDNAFVNGGNYSGNAIIEGNAYLENTTMLENAKVTTRARVKNYYLYGTVEVGGDTFVYNDEGYCNNGVYNELSNYYKNELLPCDNRSAQDSRNADINNTYSLFSNAEMNVQSQGCLNLSTPKAIKEAGFIAYPNPANKTITLKSSSIQNSDCNVSLYSSLGAKISEHTLSRNNATINVEALAPGLYLVEISTVDNKTQTIKFVKE